jgi:von Willebrand factor type A domain/Aerotolerance regulator N-terminal
MQFMNPAAFLVLGFIPILILIHSLKPKPKKVFVTDLFLWRQASNERRGGAKIRRLVKNLPLYLQILAVVLAALSLSKPVWLSPPRVEGDAVLILDTSASMKARTASGTRFDQARAEALRLIDVLPKGGKMLIIEAGSKPVVKSHFSGDKKQLTRIVEGIKPHDVPGRIEKAITLALSFMDPETNDQVFLISDGSGFDFTKYARIYQRVRPILVRGGTKNIGITRFQFRPEIDAPEHYEIMLEVRNYNPHPVLCPIHLTLKRETIVKKTVGLKALEKKLFIFPYPGPVSGRAHAVLEIQDDFPVDNEAFAVLNERRDIWILLVTKGNYYLEKLLHAYPNFMINSVKEIIPSSWEDQTMRHDIVILDRISPPSTVKGNFLLIDAFSPSIPISRTGQVQNPVVLDWDRENPLLANLDIGDLAIERANQIKADEALRPIIESRETGLMYAYEEGGLRAVYLGFDLTRSDLPLRVAFPVMMSNIFEWLQPRTLLFSSSQTRSGLPFMIHLGPRTERFSVAPPSGKWEEYPAQPNPFNYENTSDVGIYTVAEGEKWRHFAVNLEDETESDIRIPDFEPKNGVVFAQTGPEPLKEETPLWIVFLSAAAAALILEWYFWLKGR